MVPLLKRRASPRFMLLAGLGAVLLTGGALVAWNWDTSDHSGQRSTDEREVALPTDELGYLDIEHDGKVEISEFGYSVETRADGVVSVMWAAIVENTSPDYPAEATFTLLPETDDGEDWNWNLREAVPPGTTTGISDVTLLDENMSVTDATLEVAGLGWTSGGSAGELRVGDVEIAERSPDRTRVSFELESTFQNILEPSPYVVLRDEDGSIIAGTSPDDIAEWSKAPPGSSTQYIDIDRALPGDIDLEATEVYVSTTPVD